MATKRLWQTFLQLNIYKKPFDDQPSTLKDLIATRIYIFTLTIFVIIITLTAGFYPRTVTTVEYFPSSTRFAKLIEDHPSTLHCPCSKFSTSYGTFVTVKINFHQVCSSQFIEQTWIDQVYAQHNQWSPSVSSDDHRTTLSMFWQIISSFCSISDEAWRNIIQNFEGSYIINPTIQAELSVRSQVREALNYEKSLSQTTLTRNLRLLQRLTSGNQLVSGISTNFELRYPNDTNPPKMFTKKYGNCSCVSIDGCPHVGTFNDINGQLVTIPGLIADCLIVDSVLASTLECYYNQTCISFIHKFLTNEIQPLSINKNKHFTINSTVKMLFDEIMTDEFITDINFDLYYSECHPIYCVYSYARRFDLLFVFTTVIGLIGTLSIVIRIIAPFIASIYLRRQNKNIPVISIVEESQNSSVENHHFIRIKEIIVELNLFEGRSVRTAAIISRERILTRYFIILMISTMIIISIYIFIQKQNQIITIHNPSLEIYYQLYNKHSNSLKCPCSNLFISYEKFLNMSVVLHQICSSDLVSSDWLNYLASFNPNLVPSWSETPYSRDFRVIGASYFQILNAFCTLANESTTSSQQRFINNQFISDYVHSPSQLFQETQLIIDLFINTTYNIFAREYDWIQFAFRNSLFLSGTNINFYVTIDDNEHVETILALLWIVAQRSEGDLVMSGVCGCGTGVYSSQCSVIPFIYTNGSEVLQFDQIFWELAINCLPIIGFSTKDTSWWYNDSYLQNIKNTYIAVLHYQPSSEIKPLDQSISSQFLDPTISNLLSAMFIEKWIVNNTQFNRYYQECSPLSCSYTIYERRPIIVIILLIIAICGGLNKGLRLFVIFMGKIIFTIVNKFKNRNNNRNNQISHIPQNIFRKIINLNLFETIEQDESIKQKQKIDTKVYLILFTISLGIILFYTVINERSVIKVHLLNSVDDYEYLYDQYGNDVSCPCSQISIPYGDFVTELYVDKFYQECGYNSISNILFDDHIVSWYYEYGDSRDFRYSKNPMLDSITQLCSLAETSINNSIQEFFSSSIISNRLIPRYQFEIEINRTINLFQKKIPIAFSQTLNLIRTIMHGNALVTVISPNWNYIVAERNQGRNGTFRVIPSIYNNCSCATSQTCSMPAQLFEYNGTLYYTMKSFVLGCNQLETVLLSSLSCLYSITCINEFRQAFYTLEKGPGNYDRPSYMTLDSEITRFNINDTIEILASEMFIETWISNVSYERYFNSCISNSCTYTYYYRFDLFDLLTTFLSVFGGLSVGLRLLVPYLVGIIIKIRNHFRIVPISHSLTYKN